MAVNTFAYGVVCFSKGLYVPWAGVIASVV